MPRNEAVREMLIIIYIRWLAPGGGGVRFQLISGDRTTASQCKHVMTWRREDFMFSVTVSTFCNYLFNIASAQTVLRFCFRQRLSYFSFKYGLYRFSYRRLSYSVVKMVLLVYRLPLDVRKGCFESKCKYLNLSCKSIICLCLGVAVCHGT